MPIKQDYLVKKRNDLNEIRANSMSLQELRFFSIYLSKINPRDVSTRVVRFSIQDFQRIMELGRINISYMKQVTNSLLCKVVNVPNERGGYSGFQLFKECTFSADEEGEWYVEIDAHDKALPLMFEYKEKYFSYQLWNALRLKSSNQLRMYELLKQYEKIGSRVIMIDDLKAFLGIEKDEYKAYKNFRIRVLDACQQALREHTDIQFSYEPYGKRGKGGKILSLKFYVEKNKEYIDQLTLEDFIEQQNPVIEDQSEYVDQTERLTFIADACNNEFSNAEIRVLLTKMRKTLPLEMVRNDILAYDYIAEKYREMVARAEKTNITHRFGYMKSIV